MAASIVLFHLRAPPLCFAARHPVLGLSQLSPCSSPRLLDRTPAKTWPLLPTRTAKRERLDDSWRRGRNLCCGAHLAEDAPFAIAIGACILNSLVFPVRSEPEDGEEDSDGGVIDSADMRFAVMGILSFIPYFNWMSWIFAWLDTSRQRYLVYSIVYLAPYLRVEALVKFQTMSDRANALKQPLCLPDGHWEVSHSDIILFYAILKTGFLLPSEDKLRISDCAVFVRTNLSLSPDDSWLPIASILACIVHIQLEASIRSGDINGIPILEETLKHLSPRKRKDASGPRRRTEVHEKRTEIHAKESRKQLGESDVWRKSLDDTWHPNEKEDLNEDERNQKR